MAKRIREVTRDFLKAVPLPVQTSSYTVISHESVMDYVFTELAAQGFGILSEEYRCTYDGLIAQGIYKLNYGTDEEMSLMFAWSNSYNKQLKFKCVTGGYVTANQTVMLCGEIGTWTRKHTGTADADAIEMIKTQITNAAVYYNNLVADKEVMKQIPLTTKRQAELLGVLFAEYELLTTEQASIVRQQIDKPSFFYNGGKHTLWSFYNHVTLAFQQSHPKTWMEDQRMLHWFISNEFDLTGSPVMSAIVQAMVEVTEPMVDPLYTVPNQTNILDQIADLEADQMDEDIRYAKVEEESGTNEVKNEEILYQSEEVVEDVVEDTEVPFDIDEDDDAVLGSLLVPIENPEPPVTVEEYLDHKELLDETVAYTDPAGNVFEAPVVQTKAPQEFIDALMNAPEMDASEIDMSKVTWVDAPETVKEVEDKPKLSLDDILIRIPNEEKKAEAEIATAIERVERKELKETLKAEDQKGKLPSDIQSRLDAFNAKREAESSILTPEEIEEEYDLKHTDDYQDVIEMKAEESLEVEAVNTTENQPSTFNDFEFDLGSDDEELKFDDDFL